MDNTKDITTEVKVCKSNSDKSWLYYLLQIKGFEPQELDDEGIETTTSIEQRAVEKSVATLFNVFFKKAEFDPEEPLLYKKLHITYLTRHLTHLPQFYEILVKTDIRGKMMEHLYGYNMKYMYSHGYILCQNEDGGFGGGPGQISHLAPTYAAVNAICSMALPEAFSLINRETLKKFLRSVKQEDGSFCMHIGGELDIRGVYCATSVARLTNVYSDDLFTNSAEWIVTCQTYEGGFGGIPGMEAHGGYAFCAIAALSLLRKEHLCDIKSLLRWTVNKQMRFEGGFQGRTNKLVDGCYSFWQGGAVPIIQRIICMQGGGSQETDRWLFHTSALQQYILVCCQSPSGGLLDKPSKPRDIYHSCYTLSGLSVAQNQPLKKPNVLGPTDNLLEPVHPLYNIGLSKVKPATDYFMQLPIPR